MFSSPWCFQFCSHPRLKHLCVVFPAPGLPHIMILRRASRRRETKWKLYDGLGEVGPTGLWSPQQPSAGGRLPWWPSVIALNPSAWMSAFLTCAPARLQCAGSEPGHPRKQVVADTSGSQSLVSGLWRPWETSTSSLVSCPVRRILLLSSRTLTAVKSDNGCQRRAPHAEQFPERRWCEGWASCRPAEPS